MKNSGYMTRALRARDPRFAHILGKLGYERGDMTAVEQIPGDDDIATVRAEYHDLIGKKPFHGWDVATLLEKIAAARAAG